MVTVREILGVLGRRWYVLLVVVLCFAVLAVLLIRDGGAFTSKTVIVFTSPTKSTLEADSGATDESVIAFAGAIAAEINNGRPAARYSSADAPSYGAGVRQGVAVGLRNEGGQWISSYPTATVDVQIVGRTYEWVRQTQTTILREIEATTQAQQSASVIAVDDRITATVEPLTLAIEQITPGRTDRIIGVVALLLAAVLVGSWASVVVDRVARRRTLGGVAR